MESDDDNQGQDCTLRLNNVSKDDTTTTTLLNLIKQLAEKVDQLTYK